MGAEVYISVNWKAVQEIQKETKTASKRNPRIIQVKGFIEGDLT